MQRLLDLGLVRRDIPFGATLKDSKRTLYVIEDPFLRFWFRFVDPERSRLETRQIDVVAESEDKRALLFGEAAWSRTADAGALAAELARKARNFPLAGRRHVVFALWVKSPTRAPNDVRMFGPDDVLGALRA